MTEGTPDFSVEARPEGGLLHVRFTGRSDKENAAAMTRRYFDLVLASGERRILADIRELKERLPDAETYFLLRALPVQPVPTGYRTAILDAPENRRFATFLETTGANAGVAFKCFFDPAEALAWLRSND